MTFFKPNDTFELLRRLSGSSLNLGGNFVGDVNFFNQIIGKSKETCWISYKTRIHKRASCSHNHVQISAKNSYCSYNSTEFGKFKIKWLKTLSVIFQCSFWFWVQGIKLVQICDNHVSVREKYNATKRKDNILPGIMLDYEQKHRHSTFSLVGANFVLRSDLLISEMRSRY